MMKVPFFFFFLFFFLAYYLTLKIIPFSSSWNLLPRIWPCDASNLHWSWICPFLRNQRRKRFRWRFFFSSLPKYWPLFLMFSLPLFLNSAPSQMLENWCYETTPLKMMSKHIETGNPLPDELIEKLYKSRLANTAHLTKRQILFATFDQTIHTMEKADTVSLFNQFSDSVFGIPATEGSFLSSFLLSPLLTFSFYSNLLHLIPLLALLRNKLPSFLWSSCRRIWRPLLRLSGTFFFLFVCLFVFVCLFFKKTDLMTDWLISFSSKSTFLTHVPSLCLIVERSLLNGHVFHQV